MTDLDKQINHWLMFVMTCGADKLIKPKSFPLIDAWPFCAPLRRSCLFILSVNWVMQGMRGMQCKELSFRLIAGISIAAVVYLILLSTSLTSLPSLLFSLAIAHSFNFSLNGQVWVCARYCRWYRSDHQTIEAYTQSTLASLRNLEWLEEAVVIGSRAGASRIASDRSDIDLRLVFPLGWRAWLRTNLLLLRLRACAFVRMIPLDLYAYDDPSALERFDQCEPLAIALDRRGRLARRYATSRRLNRI